MQQASAVTPAPAEAPEPVRHKASHLQSECFFSFLWMIQKNVAFLFIYYIAIIVILTARIQRIITVLTHCVFYLQGVCCEKEWIDEALLFYHLL